MPDNIMFSILIPSVPIRVSKMEGLFKILEKQINGRNVEVLSFLDNKKRTIGYKRDALVQIARGKYLSFVDDDDMVSQNYIDEILTACEKDVDLIMFNQGCTINNGNMFTVRYGLDYKNEEAHVVDGKWVDIKRQPFHSCVWKSEIAKTEHFPDASYGEDWHWAKRLIPKVKTSVNIDKILQYYIYNDKTTEAELIFPKD